MCEFSIYSSPNTTFDPGLFVETCQHEFEVRKELAKNIAIERTETVV
jgi:hypothetical protein